MTKDRRPRRAIHLLDAQSAADTIRAHMPPDVRQELVNELSGKNGNVIIIAQNDHPPLRFGNFEILPIGLVIHGKPDIHEWLSAGWTFRRLETAIQWVLGDWLNYGESRYGEMYSQALDETDYKYQTLMDYAWVARQVEFSLRKENLSWSHHKEVASLSPQDQFDKLNMAEQMGLSVRELRGIVRDNPNGRPADKPIAMYTAQVIMDGSAVILEILDGDIEALIGMAGDSITITIKR